MFFPIGDEPNPRGFAAINWMFIAANILVYFFVSLPLGVTSPAPNDPVLREYLMLLDQSGLPARVLAEAVRGMSQYDLFVFEHGYRPAAPELSDLFTSLFLHAGLMHLAGNMLFLWIYGDNIEARMGRISYVAMYLTAGIAGSVLHGILSGGSQMPLVGASGAISGVLGAYFVFFPSNRIRILVLLPFYLGVVKVRARWVLALYFVFENVFPLFFASGSSVAYGAHIGGFLLGFALALWFQWRDQGTRRDGLKWLAAHDHRDLDQPHAADSFSDKLTALLTGGNINGATRTFLDKWDEPESWRVPPAQLLQMADWLRLQREGRLAAGIYNRVLKTARRGPDASHAYLGIALVYLDLMNQPVEAYQFLQRAFAAGPAPELRGALEDALHRISELQKLPLRNFREI